jgi:hypothetical protein
MVLVLEPAFRTSRPYIALTISHPVFTGFLPRPEILIQDLVKSNIPRIYDSPANTY